MAAAVAARRLALAPLRSSSSCLCSAQTLRASRRVVSSVSSRSFTASSQRPEKLYSEQHEWLDISDDGKTGTVGISTYAAKALGDVVFVELPETGLDLADGDAMGAVESVKSASDIYSPAAGRVSTVNTELEEKPSIINSSPEELGWIVKLDLAEGEAARAREQLMDGGKYKAFTEE